MAHPGLKLSPSMERCDWLNMERDIRSLEEAKVDYLHIDIMDMTYGHSILLSPNLVPMIKKVTDIPLDIHFFLKDTDYFLPQIMEVCDEKDYITVQMESIFRPAGTLARIKDHGLRAGVVLEIGSPVCMLENLLPHVDMVNLMIRDPGIQMKDLNPTILKKIRDTRALMDAHGMEEADLSVDGSIRYQDVPILMEAGANMMVLGSKVVFRPGHTYAENCAELREMLGL